MNSYLHTSTSQNPSSQPNTLVLPGNFLVTIIKNMPIRSINAKEKFQQEVAHYRSLTETLLERESPEAKLPQADFRNYTLYVFRERTKEEKREILFCHPHVSESDRNGYMMLIR